jgi:hypothetical protein
VPESGFVLLAATTSRMGGSIQKKRTIRSFPHYLVVEMKADVISEVQIMFNREVWR